MASCPEGLLWVKVTGSSLHLTVGVSELPVRANGRGGVLRPDRTVPAGYKNIWKAPAQLAVDRCGQKPQVRAGKGGHGSRIILHKQASPSGPRLCHRGRFPGTGNLKIH